ncbi:MAG: hypothetical protein JOZ41_19355 [Chloroflexi bacterium]|nr:hypothetical protein [Chloroflexota bacterium]
MGEQHSNGHPESTQSQPLSRTAFELQGALGERPEACCVCLVVGKALRDHVDGLFYERVNDLQTRDVLREAGGFCRYHARLVLDQADALGSALILRDMLQQHLRRLEGGQLARLERPASGLSRLFDVGGKEVEVAPACPLCPVERELERVTVESLLAALANADFLAAFGRTPGLCLPHLRLAHATCKDESEWERVRAVEEAGLKNLISELGELARKSDYRFAAEARGSESDSWKRALFATSRWIEL